jgi:rhodanese-related sulfurtransferase
VHESDHEPIERISRDALVACLTDPGARLVEALGPSFFGDVRLPGAVNLPPARVDDLAARVLPDASDMIVVYCSRTCSNAEETARRLVRLGYRDVRVFAEGKEDWIEAGLPIERDPGPG